MRVFGRAVGSGRECMDMIIRPFLAFLCGLKIVTHNQSHLLFKTCRLNYYFKYFVLVYRASHAYTGSTEDELTFKQDETVLVLQETDTGWWRGSTYLGEGWFPSTFVEVKIVFYF